MTDYITLFFKEIYILFIEMSPYLLLGMTVAGLLSVFVKRELVARHVGGHNMGSVIKSALLGVPLPLCSCGVIPTASYLKKYGASKPAVMSFLISTPQTGVDSLTATWGMLGPLFALFRALTALITGVAGGMISYLFDREEESGEGESLSEARAFKEGESRVKHFLNFAYRESVDDIAVNFLIGLSLAALISLLIPDNFFEGTLLGGGLFSMLLMVAIGIPMYVCSTSSIPIAVALILKGFSPGAAYVFLVAGPATNAATLAILTRVLGKKQTLFYLGTIVVGSLVFGLAMNGLTALTGWKFAGSVMEHHMMF
ncbi:MAG: permease, partial [Spirochaetales bacterium]|nr:permease [Spirochaetales bacterium]